MSTIRIVWGSATAPTRMSSYDAALAEAGVENYNLVSVSSVIPAGVDVDPVGTAPDLGPAGERLTVVEARATVADPRRASAALAWAQSDRGDGPGLFYEASGASDPEAVERRVREGLAAGQELREWAFDDPRVRVESARSEPESPTGADSRTKSPAESGSRGDEESYTTALVLAVYGESEPLL